MALFQAFVEHLSCPTNLLNILGMEAVAHVHKGDVDGGDDVEVQRGKCEQEN